MRPKQLGLRSPCRNYGKGCPSASALPRDFFQMTHLAKESNNVAYVAAIGQVTEHYNDATEVAALLKEYRGSYIMAFAGYNAGRGRVAEWVAKQSDPRDPKVDAVDWIERIPFAETRNYVQRVMENLQVYCARF